MESEILVGFGNERAAYIHDLGGIKRIVCTGTDNYTGDYQVETASGKDVYLGGKPAFFFLVGLGFTNQELAEAVGAPEGMRIFVDDPEAIAPIIRMIIHAEEYIDRLGNGREPVSIELPLFPSRRAALDYLRRAQVHALGDTWEGFNVNDRHYPDPDWRERLRKMGL